MFQPEVNKVKGQYMYTMAEPLEQSYQLLY